MLDGKLRPSHLVGVGGILLLASLAAWMQSRNFEKERLSHSASLEKFTPPDLTPKAKDSEHTKVQSELSAATLEELVATSSEIKILKEEIKEVKEKSAGHLEELKSLIYKIQAERLAAGPQSPLSEVNSKKLNELKSDIETAPKKLAEVQLRYVKALVEILQKAKDDQRFLAQKSQIEKRLSLASRERESIESMLSSKY